ncbi:GNAT family N-acetyltransferase [Allorhizocola rhizosphaerae]|uniref:GNAT family N-acetyltransferase n=1 Tax=Allorhizocola rhizosphaerae TaxID=1872709 RepID=UPI000E3E28F3|nr:GNAT family N-acetyltransferase [Allorhizocola rhizosphaerae]
MPELASVNPSGVCRLACVLLTFRLAEPSDAPALVALRDSAARWMAAEGIDQWRVGEMTEEHFRKRVAEDEVWVAETDGRIVGAFELWWSDERAWGPQPPIAGYVHRLMTDREAAPRGTGRAMLATAEERIVAAGRRLARLDCAAHNAGLRRYYAGAGYREVGEQAQTLGSRYPVTLLEKELTA